MVHLHRSFYDRTGMNAPCGRTGGPRTATRSEAGWKPALPARARSLVRATPYPRSRLEAGAPSALPNIAFYHSGHSASVGCKRMKQIPRPLESSSPWPSPLGRHPPAPSLRQTLPPTGRGEFQAMSARLGPIPLTAPLVGFLGCEGELGGRGRPLAREGGCEGRERGWRGV